MHILQYHYIRLKNNIELTVNKYEILQSVFLGGYIIVNLITFTLIQYEKYDLLLNILSYALLFGFVLAISYEKKQYKVKDYTWWSKMDKYYEKIFWRYSLSLVGLYASAFAGICMSILYHVDINDWLIFT